MDIIDSVDEPQGMTENEVRENLLESKDWQKTANELRKQRERIEEEMIGQTIDVELKTRFEQEAEGMMTTVSKLVKDLKLQDKERGLYSTHWLLLKQRIRLSIQNLTVETLGLMSSSLPMTLKMPLQLTKSGRVTK